MIDKEEEKAGIERDSFQRTLQVLICMKGGRKKDWLKRPLTVV